MDPLSSTVSKRLHISGLAPSISQQDLSQRLSTFGTLKSLDGLGLVDGVGRPRKFAYATLEGTPAKVTKCMNALSGSTWKGTKLRIGEAKSDFRERIQAENAKAALAPPPKKKSHWRFSPYSAVHSKKMDMLHPLKAPETVETTFVPTKSTKLKATSTKLKPTPNKPKIIFADEEVTSSMTTATATVSIIDIPQREEQPQQPLKQQAQDLNLQVEAKQSLDILSSLFGGSSTSKPSRHGKGSDIDDWIGKETLDSDVDEADVALQSISNHFGDGDMDFEIVPRDDPRSKPEQHAPDAMRMEVDEGEQAQGTKRDVEEQPHHPVVKPPSEKAPPIQTTTKLKELFAPSETEGRFSLLGHLNLDDDLELDDDVPFPTTYEETETHDQINDQTLPTTTISSSSITQKQTRFTSQITLDSSKPLFFPLALLSSHPSASSSLLSNTNLKNRPKDLFEELEATGRDWRSLEFYRTQSEDEIRQRWEQQKGELTQGWKKRWREAGKFGRRRGKVTGEDG